MLDNQVELRVEALLVRLYIHVGDRYPGSESESRIARARGASRRGDPDWVWVGKASQGWKYTERWGSGLNRNGEGSGLGLDWEWS